jgi:hypothetical protein
MDGDRILAAQHACPLGSQYLHRLPSPAPRYWRKGREVASMEALAVLSELLRDASAPGIAGLTWLTVEACTLAVRLAERWRGWLCPWPPDPIRFWGQHAPDLALSRAEIEQSADCVIYLSNDPDQVQPRHRERHLRRGLGDRRRIFRIACSGETAAFTPWPGAVDLTWPLSQRHAFIQQLRFHLERADPLADSLYPLAEAVQTARCVQVFVAPHVASDSAFLGQWQFLAARQRALRRFGVSLFGSSGKARTVTETLTWLTGFPGPLYYGSGKPQYLPGIGELDQLLHKSAFDTLLWLGAAPKRAGLEGMLTPSIRNIVLDAEVDPEAEVSIQVPTLDPRLDAHVIRGDGILLRLAGNNPGIPDPMKDLLAALLQEGEVL